MIWETKVCAKKKENISNKDYTIYLVHQLALSNVSLTIWTHECPISLLQFEITTTKKSLAHVRLKYLANLNWIETCISSWSECRHIVCSPQYIFSLCPPLLSVAPVIYWFSARLPLLSVAHCWQSFSLPAGLQSSSLSTAFLRRSAENWPPLFCMQRKAAATNSRLDFLNSTLGILSGWMGAWGNLCGCGDHPVPLSFQLVFFSKHAINYGSLWLYLFVVMLLPFWEKNKYI